MKEAKISQELSRIHKQLEKNNGAALKSSLKKKAKIKVDSTSSKKKESDSDSDDDMALFIKRLKKVMKKDGYFNNYKRRGKITRRSNKPCFGCE
jgi:tRNA C32,U32 (ribose-2'-O)-methylase TrmJ